MGGFLCEAGTRLLLGERHPGERERRAVKPGLGLIAVWHGWVQDGRSGPRKASAPSNPAKEGPG
jgi:hypothetical protein